MRTSWRDNDAAAIYINCFWESMYVRLLILIFDGGFVNGTARCVRSGCIEGQGVRQGHA